MSKSQALWETEMKVNGAEGQIQWREREDGRERSIRTFGALSWEQLGYYDPNFFKPQRRFGDMEE